MSAPAYSRAWCSGATRNLPVPSQPTEFESLVCRLGLEHRPDLWQFDRHVQDFAARNRKTRYMPESLLKELDLQVREEDVA